MKNKTMATINLLQSITKRLYNRWERCQLACLRSGRVLSRKELEAVKNMKATKVELKAQIPVEDSIDRNCSSNCGNNRIILRKKKIASKKKARKELMAKLMLALEIHQEFSFEEFNQEISIKTKTLMLKMLSKSTDTDMDMKIKMKTSMNKIITSTKKTITHKINSTKLRKDKTPSSKINHLQMKTPNEFTQKESIRYKCSTSWLRFVKKNTQSLCSECRQWPKTSWIPYILTFTKNTWQKSQKTSKRESKPNN